MPRQAHTTTVGSWFFQATVESAKLTNMVNNPLAAHQNKPRGRRAFESTLFPDNWFLSGTPRTQQNIQSYDEGYQCLLSGVRVVYGRQRGSGVAGATGWPNHADIEPVIWVGDPALLFPQGMGLPPFIRRPVITCSVCAFVVDQLDLGNNVEIVPGWQDYDLHSETQRWTDDHHWIRAVPGRILGTDHEGRSGPTDTTLGIRFRLLFGRLGLPINGQQIDSGVPPEANPNYRGIYIHWQAMGPVEAY